MFLGFSSQNCKIKTYVVSPVCLLDFLSSYLVVHIFCDIDWTDLLKSLKHKEFFSF